MGQAAHAVHALSLTAQSSKAAEKPSANRVRKTEGPSVRRADASYADALFLSLMRASPHPTHINNDPPPSMQAHACMQHHDRRAGRAQGGSVVQDEPQLPRAREKKKSRKAASLGGSMDTLFKFVCELNMVELNALYLHAGLAAGDGSSHSGAASLPVSAAIRNNPMFIALMQLRFDGR